MWYFGITSRSVIVVEGLSERHATPSPKSSHWHAFPLSNIEGESVKVIDRFVHSGLSAFP